MTFSFINPLLKIIRISNAPTVISNTLVGVALAGVVAGNTNIFLLVTAMILFYSAGMVLNDIFDFELDKVERPERPLPSGTISQKNAKLLVGALFLVGFVRLIKVGAAVVCTGIILFVLIFAYNQWHKKNPLSPLMMALCRVMVYVIGFVAFAATFKISLLFAAIGLGIYLSALTYYAKHTTKHHHIGWLVAGISLYDTLVLLILKAWIFAVIAVVAFVLTIILQKYIKGT